LPKKSGQNFHLRPGKKIRVASSAGQEFTRVRNA